ncbi:hypothetical protein AAE478_008727 [Parahypoxylon ruwenzoriense]
MVTIQRLATLLAASLLGGATAAVIERDVTRTGSGTVNSRATTTATAQACTYVDRFCLASGLNIDYYYNPLGTYGREGFPSSYYITQGLTPLGSSLTNVTGFVQNDIPRSPNDPDVTHPNPEFPDAGGAYYPRWTRDTNGGVVVDANNFTLVYSGFYRAPLSGTYTLCASADNRNEMFFGNDNAFNCWDGTVPTGAKPLAVATGAYFNNPETCVQVNLEAGRYYPVRNVMGNWQSGSAFSFTVQVAGLPCSSNSFPGLVYPVTCALLA